MESGTGNVQQIRMLPPPPGTFKDREELIAYVQNFAVNHGYVVTIKNSKRESDVYLSCHRGGTPRKRCKGELKRKRKLPSRLINCPFEVVGRKDDDVWILRIKNGEHNHEPLKDLSKHPYSRRFSEDEVRQIKEMVEADVKPREVLETLKRNNPVLQSTLMHVRNLKAKIIKGQFSEASYKSWKPTSGASSSRIDLVKVSNFIGGNLVDSAGNIFADVVNPATQEVLSQVPSSTYDELRSAIFAAKQALPSWRSKPVSVRQRIIFKLSELIRGDIVRIPSIELDELVKRAAELKVYEGTDETADIGPVISPEAKARICRSVQNAVEGGARLVLDGRNIVVPAYEEGSFVAPTILSGIKPSMAGFEADVLGPLLLCTQVDSLEEVITFVNQQKVRTGASMYTTSGFTAKKFQNEVEAGLVGVNVPVSIPLPFCSTGLPSSFVGNLNFYGKAGVQFYTQVKLVSQHWKGLTSKRIPSTETLTFETNLAHQTAPTSTSDLSSHESSSMQETSDTDMTERPVNRLCHDDLSNIRLTDSTSNLILQGLITADINLSLAQRSNWLNTIPSTSLLSDKSEVVRPLLQHIDSSRRLLSEGPSMLASRRFDGFAIPFHGEREYIQTESEAQWNGNVIPYG